MSTWIRTVDDDEGFYEVQETPLEILKSIETHEGIERRFIPVTLLGGTFVYLNLTHIVAIGEDS